MRCRYCPFRLKRCCAQLAVTALVTLLLCYVAYIQETVSPITEADAVAIAANHRLAYPKRYRAPASHHQTSDGRNPSAAAEKRPPRKPVVAIIHQSWSDKNLPPMYAHWSASFDTCFPGYKRILWTDADNRDLIARHYPWFLPRYDSLSPGVQRADVSRLFYMHKFGGIYCDLDCECLTGFQHLLSNTSLALGAMEGSLISVPNPNFVAEGQVQNSFMYSRPEHPFFWNLILKLNATREELGIMGSGTYMLINGINEARRTSQDRGLFDGLPYLTVYPAHMFNPFSSIHLSRYPNCRLFGDLTPELVDRCRQTVSNNSYILQYHTQIWDKGKANVPRWSGQNATTAPEHS